MLRKHLPGLSIGALGVVAGVAALQTARAEPAASLRPAITGYPTANSQVKQQTLAANTAFGHGASGGDVGSSGRRARSGIHHGHLGGDLHGFVGGNFIPWPFYPYYNYCAHHPADQNC